VRGARSLIVVESYWSVFRLSFFGASAVAMMGRELSVNQIELLAGEGMNMSC